MKWRDAFGGRALLGWVPLLVFVIVVETDAFLHTPEAKAHVEKMKAAFVPPPSTVAIPSADCHEGWKPRQAFYSCTYRALVTEAAIVEQYEQDLKAHGWVRGSCELSAHAACWQKQEYVASLEWRGKGANNWDWDFAVDYSWHR